MKDRVEEKEKEKEKEEGRALIMRGQLRFVNGAVYDVVGFDPPDVLVGCHDHHNDPCDVCFPPDSPRDLLP